MLTRTTIAILLVLLMPLAPLAAQKPVDKVELLGLLVSSGSSQRMARLVEQRGIDFEVTDEYLETLRAAGAKKVLLQALREAKLVKPSTPEAATPSKEILFQHLARIMHKP